MFFVSACGNGGSITFVPGRRPTAQSKPSDFTMTPGALALMVENGQTTATGYHAKIQLTPLGGVKAKTTDNHNVTYKFTTR